MGFSHQVLNVFTLTCKHARSCHFYGFSLHFFTVLHFDVSVIWFGIASFRCCVILSYSWHHLYLFCQLLLFLPLFLHRFVINYSRNSLPEYVNMEWSPLWLVNRIHEHSVNSSIFERPTWYWMVPSSSNAYFSTEHSSDCWREKKNF